MATNFTTSAGNNTVTADAFSGPLSGTVTTAAQQVAAAGSNSQANATAVVPGIVIVITATTTTRGIRLSTAATNSRYEVYNAVTTNMQVFPATGAAINGGSANASVLIAPHKGNIFVYRSATHVASLS